MNIKVSIREYNIEKYIDSIQEWKIPEQDKTIVKKFFKDLEIGKVTGRPNNRGSVSSYFAYIRVCLHFFNKPLQDLTKEDIDELNEALLKNIIKKKRLKDGKCIETPFEEIGKIKLKNALILLLKHTQREKAIPLIELLKIKPRLKQKTVSYLTEQEIEKLYKGCKSAEERFLVAVLFDSGARAEEFHNIRREDIELPKESGYVKLTLKEEYSKTKGRTISLYWKHSLEAVREYLNERIEEGLKADDIIYKRDYRASRGFLDRLGKRILEKHIHYHLFRHSSATHYASELNRQQLCIRYGWKFSSPMPDIYISRKGLQDKELDEKFENVERIKIKEVNDKLRFELANIKEKSEQDAKDRALLQKEFLEFKNIAEKLKTIAKNQQKQIQMLRNSR